MEEYREVKAAARSKRLNSVTRDKSKLKSKQRQKQAQKKLLPQKGGNTTVAGNTKQRFPPLKRESSEEDEDEEEGEEEGKEKPDEVEGEVRGGRRSLHVTQTHRRSKYSRRVLQNNAYRYEEEEEEEGETTDFRQLLQAAELKEADSFTFQEGRDWEEEGEEEEEEQGQLKTPLKTLDLDLSILTQSLLALPIHQRLGLEAEMFPEEMLRGKEFPRTQPQEHHPHNSNSMFLVGEQAEEAPMPRVTVDKTREEDEELLEDLIQLDSKKNGASEQPDEKKFDEKEGEIEKEEEEDLESWLDTVI